MKPSPPEDFVTSGSIALTHHCTDEPDTFVLDVTTLAHGPDAVGRHDGRVIFVPAAAPGDRVRVRIVEQHGSYARAAVVHRCASSPTYREPPCPWITVGPV